MENVVLNVSGMSCGHCVSSIEGAVGELAGVETVKVDLDNATVAVAFSPDKVTLAQIKEAIDDQGYDVA
ncbi:copper chaperone CopZ [Bacillus fonticola]|uniref:copper chaperone CopZ n=1 Tax=Bacillus fonticola TaxID=2728853 RepID=UPI001475DAD8|nr:copper chaperone CopZ [Bacillus fonticola]